MGSNLLCLKLTVKVQCCKGNVRTFNRIIYYFTKMTSYLPARQFGLSLYFWDMHTRITTALSTADAMACNVDPSICSTSSHTRNPISCFK